MGNNISSSSVEIKNALFMLMVFCPDSKQETHFRAKKWAHAHRINQLLNHLLHYPEATGQVERWNSLLKPRFQCQLGEDILNRQTYILQKDIYALNQRSTYGTVSLIARIHGSGNQEVEMRTDPFIISSNNSLVEFLFSIFNILSSVCFEVFISPPKKYFHQRTHQQFY